MNHLPHIITQDRPPSGLEIAYWQLGKLVSNKKPLYFREDQRAFLTFLTGDSKGRDQLLAKMIYLDQSLGKQVLVCVDDPTWIRYLSTDKASKDLPAWETYPLPAFVNVLLGQHLRPSVIGDILTSALLLRDSTSLEARSLRGLSTLILRCCYTKNYSLTHEQWIAMLLHPERFDHLWTEFTPRIRSLRKQLSPQTLWSLNNIPVPKATPSLLPPYWMSRSAIILAPSERQELSTRFYLNIFLMLIHALQKESSLSIATSLFIRTNIDFCDILPRALESMSTRRIAISCEKRPDISLPDAHEIHAFKRINNRPCYKYHLSSESDSSLLFE